MIEINLLPRAGKKAGRRSGAVSLGALGGSLADKVRDPYLTGAVVTLVLAALAIGGLQWRTTVRAGALAEQERQAMQDSTRYTAILKEKRAAEAQRDSIVAQLEIIRSIDHDRYVWPHIMEEVSRALPAYTWLTSLNQTSAVVSRAARPDSAQAKADSAAVAAGASRDSLAAQPLQFRIVGHTVDIQALTRFMKQLEASPFIQNVQIARTDAAVTDGQQVTEFQLDAEYETPPPSAIRTVPVTLSVR
ncbi:MAG TPA: PilN domain-containing protein [Gemmatimonadaceae bacterium]|nr:PilN domain-containing protein [Gemmatimonadaceae bacterium]